MVQLLFTVFKQYSHISSLATTLTTEYGVVLVLDRLERGLAKFKLNILNLIHDGTRKSLGVEALLYAFVVLDCPSSASG